MRVPIQTWSKHILVEAASLLLDCLWSIVTTRAVIQHLQQRKKSSPACLIRTIVFLFHMLLSHCWSPPPSAPQVRQFSITFVDFPPTYTI